jgi:hypothetical protein
MDGTFSPLCGLRSENVTGTGKCRSTLGGAEEIE